MAQRRFRRVAVTVLVASLLLPEAHAAVTGQTPGEEGGPRLVSVAVDGKAADGASFGPSISADGRYVAFASSATTLVAGDSNGVEDVFVSDGLRGHTIRVSVSSAGVQGDAPSFGPSISADGRYVAFASFASTLVADGPKGVLNIFRHDIVSGTTIMVSAARDGTPADGPSMAPSISGDGHLVAFESDATNLVPGDHNATRDIFVRDITTAETRRIDMASDGTETESPSFAAAISADGSAVAFESFSARLVPGDTNRSLDVFVAELPSGSISRVSMASNGAQGNDRSSDPSINADGTVVAFTSFATNLDGAVRNPQLNVFLHQRTTGKTTRLSTGLGGADPDGCSFTPRISADGLTVVFASDADNLVPGHPNGTRDVFLADATTGLIARLSANPSGGQGNGPSFSPAINAAGDEVTFTSFATNLDVDATNGRANVFLAGHHHRLG